MMAGIVYDSCRIISTAVQKNLLGLKNTDICRDFFKDFSKMHLFHIIMHDLSRYVVIFLQLYFSFVLAFMLCLDCLNCCSCFSLNLLILLQ
jgi:hypothetical protein